MKNFASEGGARRYVIKLKTNAAIKNDDDTI